MPLNRRNTRNFTRTLRAGCDLQRLYLVKRGDDQLQGQQVRHLLFACWRTQITKSGQTLSRAMTGNNRTTWFIPLSELKRRGVNHLSPVDQIEDPVGGGTWQPEADTTITEQMFGNVVKVECKRTDPA